MSILTSISVSAGALAISLVVAGLRADAAEKVNLFPLAGHGAYVEDQHPVPISAWVIESADYTGEMKDQIARLEARYTIRVLRDGWVEIPLALQGATITNVVLEKKSGEAHVAPKDGAYVLAASRKGTYKVRVSFSVRQTQDSQFEGVGFGIPQATFSTLTVSVPRKAVELRPEDQLYVQTQPDAAHEGVKLTARLGAGKLVDLRWRTKPAAPVKVEPVLYGAVNTLVTVEEQLARFTSMLDYRMAQGETRELTVRLPAGVNILNVRGAGIEDWRVAEAQDAKTLTVMLTAALKDASYRLVVEGEQTIDAQSAAYELPELQLVNVKQERGYLAVSRTGSIELSPETVEGSNRVDVKELPEFLRTALGAPAMLAFKYHQHPYRVTLELTRHQDHPVLAAIAERGELVTVVSRQGELLTRAAFLIRANKKQFLTVTLPDKASLWSCLVNGQSIKPVEGAAGTLLVPIDSVGDSAQAVPVELVYFERRPEMTGIGRLGLQGPVLDIPTTVANWLVYAPREIKLLRVSGNLERGDARVEFVDEPFVQLASGTSGNEPAFGRSFTEQRVRSSASSPAKSADRLASIEKMYNQSLDAEPSPPSQAAGQGEREGRDEPGQKKNGTFEASFESWSDRMQEAGILPLKIRIPRSGDVYRFNRLMTTQEPLELSATFVHLRLPQVPFAAVGFLLAPIGAVTLTRFLRA